MPTLRTIRRIVTWLWVGLLGTVLFGVAGEWFIHVAEDKGWYANAGKTWDALVSGFLSALTSQAAIYAAVGMTCFTAGMWIDFILYRRERAPIEAAIERREIDKARLASDAIRVGNAICMLAAQGAAKERIAWEADSTASINDRSYHGRSHQAREQAHTQEKYAELYHAEAWRIVDLSRRLLNVDGQALWNLQHMSMARDIDNMGRLLISLGNELLYPGNPLLPDTQEMQRISHAAKLAERRQLPQDTGQETPR